MTPPIAGNDIATHRPLKAALCNSAMFHVKHSR